MATHITMNLSLNISWRKAVFEAQIDRAGFRMSFGRGQRRRCIDNSDPDAASNYGVHSSPGSSARVCFGTDGWVEWVGSDAPSTSPS